MEITIPHNFKPRDYQKPLFNSIYDGYKRAVAVWHRRSGKDKTAINFLMKEAFQRVGAYYYFFPTYAQGRKILWDGIDRDGFRFLNHIPPEVRKNTNQNEMKVWLHNNSLLQVIGSDNIDAVVGTNPVGCVFSEYSIQDPRGYDFVRPILRENDGWAIFLYTPRGHNHGHELFQMAQDNPAWFSEILTIDDTGVMTTADVDAEREAGMAEDLVQQEFYCSFEAAAPGAYYANEMRTAREQGRVCGIPVESGVPVDTYWDLGIDDSTTIWLTQNVGREIHLVNYYENSGEALVHYVNWLMDWRAANRVMFGDHNLPHDGRNREKQTGKSAQEFLYDLGLTCSVVDRPIKKEDGIEAVRRIFSRCWFDKKNCERGIKALSQYRKEYDEKNRIFKVRPIHDWASHGADAFQTLALGHRIKTLGAGFHPKRTRKAVATRY